MKNIKKILIIFLVFLLPQVALARDYVSEWYIKEFETKIIVNEDSSLTITEKITADCGDLPGKHGIFRILPIWGTSFAGEKIKMPIKLLKITDFNGVDHKYQAIKNNLDDTITWKIGDQNVVVSGENYYQISYKVDNAVYKDVLYWNLVGSFWEMEIDIFKATIHLPEGIKEEDVRLQFYTGFFDEKGEDVFYNWIGESVLEVVSQGPLKKREGITISMFFDEGYFTPHQFTFFEIYYNYIFFIIPILTFLVLFYIWQLHGKDYKKKRPVVPEYLRPRDIDLLEAGLLLTNGKMKSEFITAIIIDMAIKKVLLIREEERGDIFKSKRIILQKLNKKDGLSEGEGYIFDIIFKEKDEVDLVTLKKYFSEDLRKIGKKMKEVLVLKNLFYKRGLYIQTIFLTTGTVIFLFNFFFGALFDIAIMASLFITSLIFFFFSFIMPKRTKEGVELFLYLKGLKEYMVTAEKERQIFYEEEGIFEKLLPYAIIFKITKKWAKKMEEVYQIKGSAYAPVWWIGGSFQGDSISSFTSSLNLLSSQISASSGRSGGGGSSGGGGGGGGGGGW